MSSALLPRAEGIVLDPVYSGKALAGLLDRVRAGRFAPEETVVFWHTGGTPGAVRRTLRRRAFLRSFFLI